MVRWFACTAVLAIAIPPLHAQDTTRVAPGDQVRVVAPARGWKRWDGTFVAVRADSVVLMGTAKPETMEVVPIADIRQFLVNHGNRPPRSLFLPGLAAGALMGLVYGVTAEALYPCDGYWLCENTIPAFTLGGAALGGIMGAFTHAPPWRAVKLSPQPTLTPLPTGAVGMGLHVDL